MAFCNFASKLQGLLQQFVCKTHIYMAMNRLLVILISIILCASNSFAQNISPDSLGAKSNGTNEQTNSNVMEGTLSAKGGGLFKPNGDPLYKDEARNYLGLKGEKIYRSSSKIYNFGMGALQAAGIIAVGGLAADADMGFNDNGATLVISVFIAVPCVAIGLPFIGIGNFRLHTLAREYNYQYIFGKPSIPKPQAY